MDTREEQLAKILVEEFGYKEQQVPEVATKLSTMDPALAAAFKKWLRSRKLSQQPDVQGFTPASIQAVYGLKPPACFLLLDWIRREPNEAQKALLEDYGREAFRLARTKGVK